MKNVNESLVKSAQVIGVGVTNAEDENLGKVEEIVLDKFSGQTRYVVLSFGGIMGLGDKFFALPWKMLSYDKAKEKFVISVNKEKLKKAEGFDKDKWPDFSSAEWQSATDQYYV